ncbi:OLC1v1015843C1 [Oldenlandia corymbosa var. corymbosa]|uniref:OLC1v1015843C1 n=1 Tax=Oldenlandia corymbosa var. corymbosa TaxID=529605 RepID=A0AAV1E446_OLDCO|nr:OLC1v1015843C1 [Oldenlandia corymbosa var. corymbosa]
MELPEGTLTLYKKQTRTQEEQSPVQTPRTQNLWRKPKRKKSTPTGTPKQLVVADDNDDKKPKKKRMKPENNKLIIGQDPRPISSEDSVKKFETRMTPNHLFQLITEINKPTDLTKEPDAVDYRQLQRQAIKDMGFGTLLDLKIKIIPTALCNFLASNFQTGARQVPLNGNNVLDIKQEDVVAILDLPCGPKPVQEFKQNDPAITDHAEMVDACEYERAHLRSFPVIKSWDQRMLDDRIRLQGSNFTDVQTLERLKKPSSATSRDEQPEAESQKEDTQGNPNTQKMPPPSSTTQLEQEQQQHQQDLQDAQICELCKMAWKSAESRFATIIEQLQRQVADQQEQQQHQQIDDNIVEAPINLAKFQDIEIDKAQGLEQLSQTNDGASIAVGKTVPTSKEVSGRRLRDNQEKNTQEDVTVRVDLDEDVNETIEAEEYPVPSALDETKNPIPSINEIITRASAPASESSSDTEKLEIIAAIAEQVEKNPENVASTTGRLLMLDKNECTTPPPAISKKAEVLDEGLTKTVEKILNQKPRRRNPPRIHRLPERFRSPFMLQKKNKKKFIQLTEENKKMTKEEALLIDFALLQRQEEIVKSASFLFEFGKIVWADRTAFYSMREGTWIENNIIDAWAVILNKEEAKSDSPSRIFFGVSAFDTISRYYQQDSNKEEIEFTFYERLALELEGQGLSVGSLIVAKAIYFPVHYREHYFLYVLLVQEKKVLAFNNLHAKDLDYYKPTKDLLFQFFKMYLQCVFPNIELVNAQFTFTEVTLPSHNDKKPNAEDCGIFTMHHMEKYDGGDYEDGTTLNFHTGNIKEYRWRYMLKILMHPSNKNKDKILEAMHQFYINTAEEEPKEIPDHVDLNSKSYYNDKKIQGWVK